jgi:heme exporter protein D
MTIEYLIAVLTVIMIFVSILQSIFISWKTYLEIEVKLQKRQRKQRENKMHKATR